MAAGGRGPQLIGRFAGEDKGLVLLEYAFMVPVLAALLLGMVDFGRFVLMHQKMQRTATTVADLVSQDDVLTVAEVQQFLSASQHVMNPFTMGSNSLVAVSSVSADSDGDTTINWRQTGAGSLDETSRIGDVGGEATMPGEFAVPAEQTVIVAEVWFIGSGFFREFFDTTSAAYHVAVARPRGVGSKSLE